MRVRRSCGLAIALGAQVIVHELRISFALFLSLADAFTALVNLTLELVNPVEAGVLIHGSYHVTLVIQATPAAFNNPQSQSKTNLKPELSSCHMDFTG